ncbi:hypothetical protein L873DRAFT_1460200 [Choiromyces venosus 120613-1]|uniref:Uncharacterized protein n=1 Tax=Choiromyces venosus 120613-1 TaxID=1336337 RepID=A0A3N4K0Z0_9PEZI|nr:hypothetical protein L873DRAFT_1460200 [Choiromyces venosus 120613-1]
MADKLDPHHLVALMSYAFRGKHDGSSRSLDRTSVNPEYGVTNKRETNIRTFPILDAIASISVSQERSQVVAVAFQLNSKEREIRLTIAENRDVEPRLVNHLDSVWRKLQALSNEFAADGGLDKNEEGSPDIPKDKGLPLRVNIFRVESDLYDVMVGLSLALNLVRKLHHDPKQGLTDDEWNTVYDESMWANEKARLVLADRNDFGLEILSQEFNGMPLLTPITKHMQKYPDHPQTPRPRSYRFPA